MRGLNGSGNKVRQFNLKRQKDTDTLLPFPHLLTSLLLPTGPHFVEYLDFTVTEDCNVLLKCKVRTAAPVPLIKGAEGLIQWHLGDLTSHTFNIIFIYWFFMSV